MVFQWITPAKLFSCRSKAAWEESNLLELEKYVFESRDEIKTIALFLGLSDHKNSNATIM